MEQRSTHTTAAASLALATHAAEQLDEPLYSLRRLLQSEGRATRKRNAAYLSAVQHDGMTAAWRQKMSHWMFEVRQRCDMLRNAARTDGKLDCPVDV